MLAIGVGGADAVDALTGTPWELKAPQIVGMCNIFRNKYHYELELPRCPPDWKAERMGDSEGLDPSLGG